MLGASAVVGALAGWLATQDANASSDAAAIVREAESLRATNIGSTSRYVLDLTAAEHIEYVIERALEAELRRSAEASTGRLRAVLLARANWQRYVGRQQIEHLRAGYPSYRLSDYSIAEHLTSELHSSTPEFVRNQAPYRIHVAASSRAERTMTMAIVAAVAFCCGILAEAVPRFRRVSLALGSVTVVLGATAIALIHWNVI